MKKLLRLLPCVLGFAFCASAAHANWEPWPVWADDGGRMTLSFRGGLAYGMGKIQNELGILTPEPYWFDPDDGFLMPESWFIQNGGLATCPTCILVGQVDLAELPAAKNLRTVGWAGAIAIGFTVPNAPQWRIEGNWDHIGETKYSAMPMFRGNLVSSEGFLLEDVVSSGVYSKLTSDIITAMFYYDFFDGHEKRVGSFVPYIGLGLGYASSHTVLELTDLFGDLSDQVAMQEFGVVTGGLLDFYTSGTTTGNVAGAAAVGFSYGIMKSTFLDFGLRAIYIPRIDWGLNNAAAIGEVADRHKDIFSARNVIYVNALLGIRFEF